MEPHLHVLQRRATLDVEATRGVGFVVALVEYSLCFVPLRHVLLNIYRVDWKFQFYFEGKATPYMSKRKETPYSNLELE